MGVKSMLESVELSQTKKLLNLKRGDYIKLAEEYEKIESEIPDSTNHPNTSFLITKLEVIKEDKQDVYQEIKKLQAKRDYLQASQDLEEYSQKTGVTTHLEKDKKYNELLIAKLTKQDELKKITLNDWQYKRYHLPVYQRKMAMLGGK